MGKTRDLLKKIRDPKETFPAKMGSIKDRNYMDLTEEKDIVLIEGNRNKSVQLFTLLLLIQNQEKYTDDDRCQNVKNRQKLK